MCNDVYRTSDPGREASEKKKEKKRKRRKKEKKIYIYLNLGENYRKERPC